MTDNSRLEQIQTPSKMPLNNKNNVVDYCTTELSKLTTVLPNYTKQVQLNTTIEHTTAISFKTFVENRHGKLKGRLGMEVNNALLYYLDSLRKQQQTTNNAIFIPGVGSGIRKNVLEKYYRIMIELQHLKSFPEINIPTLKNTIKSVLGECDKRTMDKYLKIVVKLSKEEQTDFGIMPHYDVSRFCARINEEFKQQ